MAFPLRAQDHFYVAIPQHALSAETLFRADHLRWECKNRLCVTRSHTWALDVSHCRRLAMRVGSIMTFGRPGHWLDRGELRECNFAPDRFAPVTRVHYSSLDLLMRMLWYRTADDNASRLDMPELEGYGRPRPAKPSPRRERSREREAVVVSVRTAVLRVDGAYYGKDRRSEMADEQVEQSGPLMPVKGTVGLLVPVEVRYLRPEVHGGVVTCVLSSAPQSDPEAYAGTKMLGSAKKYVRFRGGKYSGQVYLGVAPRDGTVDDLARTVRSFRCSLQLVYQCNRSDRPLGLCLTSGDTISGDRAAGLVITSSARRSSGAQPHRASRHGAR